MYQDYFRFNDKPFSIAPNPRYLYMSAQHCEALAHLSYGLHECGGFIVLSGEVGTGKTTVCRCLLEQIPPEVRLAIILNPNLDEKEMLQSVCDEFGVSYPERASLKVFGDCLNRYLLQQHAQGKRAVVIVEEAQNLSFALLEQLRLLTNLESDEKKLLQVILIGQPELLSKLERPELRQLSQRIVARFHLHPLSRGEVSAYINHRLAVAGCQRQLFPKAVIACIARLSQGIPRVINLLCDRILLGCYTQGKERADVATTVQAAREVFGKKVTPASAKQPFMRSLRQPHYITGLATAAALAFVVFFYGLDPIKNVLSRTASAGSEPIQLTSKIPIPPSGHSLVEPVGENDPGEATEQKRPLRSGLLSWSEAFGEERSEWDAYRVMLSVWGIEPGDHQPTLSPCQLMAHHSLDCWHKKGTYADLLHLNRPALLKLHNQNGDFFYGVATQFRQGQIRLSFRDGDLMIPIERLDAVWTEEYTVLWRKPKGFFKTIRPGDRSPVVGWFLNHLAQTAQPQRASAQLAQVYSQGAIELVRRMQSRCQLAVDGLLGKETIIRLNDLINRSPKLIENANQSCRDYYRS